MCLVAKSELEPVTKHLKNLYQELNCKQLQATELIANGKDVLQVSAIVRFGRDTILRWCNRKSLFIEVVKTYSNVLNIYSYVDDVKTAIEIFELLSKLLETSEFQFFIHWLKLDTGNLQALYPQLKSEQLRAAKFFVEGESIVNINKVVGVSRRTASR